MGGNFYIVNISRRLTERIGYKGEYSKSGEKLVPREKPHGIKLKGRNSGRPELEFQIFLCHLLISGLGQGSQI